MKLKNLKLTTKLAISSAAFILPVGIMLFSIITSSLASIKKDQQEINGIRILRPAISLIQAIPQYIRIYIDNAPGDADFVNKYSTDLLNEMNDRYVSHFGFHGNDNSIRSINENWDHLSNTRIRSTVLWAYREIMQDIIKLMVYTSNNTGLITDSKLENVFIISAAVHELTQAQERMNVIISLLRSIEDGAFTQRTREQLMLNLDLLIYSDNARILERFISIEAIIANNNEIPDSFDFLLKACYDRIDEFYKSVEQIINLPEIGFDSLFSVFEEFGHANNAAFRLQAASLDRLETLINNRIKQNIQQFLFLMLAAISATVFAFTFVITTVKSIKKATDTIGVIFSHLDKNDLSVQFECFSKDEIGELMSSLSDFLKKLNLSFISFIRNAKMVSTSVLELSSSAKEITSGNSISFSFMLP